jgi:hypothetical protein
MHLGSYELMMKSKVLPLTSYAVMINIFYAPDISNFPGQWKAPVSIKGEYPKM